MAFWSTIAHKLKEMIRKMIGTRTIEQKLHVAPVISSQMEEAIQLWTDMYKNKAPWLKEPTFSDPSRVVSLGLASMIASEKARTALLEFQSEITTPTEEVEVENPEYKKAQEEFAESGEQFLVTAQPPTVKQDKPIGSTKRAEYLNLQYKKLKKKLRKYVEYGIAKGGLVIKPYVVMNEDAKGKKVAEIEFDFIQADAFYPLAFDNSGNITEAAFLQTSTEKDTIYRRLEYHKWKGNSVEILNSAFKSTNMQNQGDMSGIDLGQEVPLTEVNEWKDLQTKTVINNVRRPLFAYFRMPQANTVDLSSPLGVSGFSRAVDLIKDADMQYSRLLWEYEGGELAIDIDRDALNFVEGTAKDGSRVEHSVLSQLQQRLYRKVDIGIDGNTYQPYAPALRDANYIQGLNTILMRIEDVVALSRGTLSDAASEARTATELKILKQRSYQENAEIQQALEDALNDVIYVMDAYCDLYQITEKGEYDVSYEWDDSIITDVDTELNKRVMLMQNGLSSKLETRMWYFGETERQAQESLIKIQEESQQQMQQDMAMQANQIHMNSIEEEG